jgi:hypothetical protein
MNSQSQDSQELSLSDPLIIVMQVHTLNFRRNKLNKQYHYTFTVRRGRGTILDISSQVSWKRGIIYDVPLHLLGAR